MTHFLKSNCLKVSLAASFLLFFQAGFAQPDTAALSGIMEQKARLLKNNNITLALGTKDTIVYKNDTRSFNVMRGQGDAGYITGWFVTALTLMLADDGKFALDDKVADYLPEFARYGKSYITIRHCLTHQTGIQVPSKLGLFESDRGESFEKIANSYASKEIQTNPGTEFRYSDRGIMIVAAIIEKVSKKKLDQLMGQRLFRPLGMRATNFMTMDGSLASPVHGARTSAGDLISFGRMLLNDGQARGNTILKPESVQVFRTLVSQAADMKGAPAAMASYDLAFGGWALENNGKLATAMAAPSFGGTALVVDFCRGYTYAYLLKELDKDKKADAMMDIKAAIDGGAEKHCQ